MPTNDLKTAFACLLLALESLPVDSPEYKAVDTMSTQLENLIFSIETGKDQTSCQSL